jgi:hypothetical protein
MTRAETKRDILHLYGHWLESLEDSRADPKAIRFYQWLQSMDTGILNYGDFGDSAIFQSIATWVQEWDQEPEPERTTH